MARPDPAEWGRRPQQPWRQPRARRLAVRTDSSAATRRTRGARSPRRSDRAATIGRGTMFTALNGQLPERRADHAPCRRCLSRRHLPLPGHRQMVRESLAGSLTRALDELRKASRGPFSADLDRGRLAGLMGRFPTVGTTPSRRARLRERAPRALRPRRPPSSSSAGRGRRTARASITSSSGSGWAGSRCTGRS
jgi:hypothetical protein